MLNKTSLLGIIAATIAFIAVPAFAADTFLGEGDFCRYYVLDCFNWNVGIYNFLLL